MNSAEKKRVTSAAAAASAHLCSMNLCRSRPLKIYVLFAYVNHPGHECVKSVMLLLSLRVLCVEDLEGSGILSRFDCVMSWILSNNWGLGRLSCYGGLLDATVWCSGTTSGARHVVVREVLQHAVLQTFMSKTVRVARPSLCRSISGLSSRRIVKKSMYIKLEYDIWVITWVWVECC